VKFLFLQGKRSKVIHVELSEVHGEAAVSLATVKRWYWRFKDGNFSVDDEFRSGRPRDDIGEAISQFVNKEPSLLHEFSQRGLYSARTQSKGFAHTIWE
jgi:transposase